MKKGINKVEDVPMDKVPPTSVSSNTSSKHFLPPIKNTRNSEVPTSFEEHKDT